MSYVCADLYVILEFLSMIVDGSLGLDGSGGLRRRLVTDFWDLFSFWDTRLDFPWDLPVGLVSAV